MIFLLLVLLLLRVWTQAMKNIAHLSPDLSSFWFSYSDVCNFILKMGFSFRCFSMLRVHIILSLCVSYLGFIFYFILLFYSVSSLVSICRFVCLSRFILAILLFPLSEPMITEYYFRFGVRFLLLLKATTFDFYLFIECDTYNQKWNAKNTFTMFVLLWPPIFGQMLFRSACTASLASYEIFEDSKTCSTRTGEWDHNRHP